MSTRRATAPIDTIEAHPNVGEIRGILSQLPCMDDAALPLLAQGWHNTSLLAEARRRALEPDSPLVLDALACFETVQVLFAEELQGGEDYLTVGPDVASIALKAIRDAIAAAYARPILTPSEHSSLLRAWRTIYPNDRIADPDLGSRAAEVRSLLEAIPRLAARCHDAGAAGEYASILAASSAADEDVRCAARDEAWHAAVLTSRRRIWHLLRRSASDGVHSYCLTCRQRGRDAETARVVTLCVDAACGLLVAGALEDDIVNVLTAPVSCLIPRPRTTPEA